MLRKHTEAALFQAVEAAIDLVSNGQDWTVVAVAGDHVAFCHSYWPSPDLPSQIDPEGRRFEHEVAKSSKQHYGALVVPIIWREGEDGSSDFRNPRKETVDGESRILFCITWDTHDGFDLHRMIYTRRPNGEPVFGPLETNRGQSNLERQAPGSVLIQSVIHPGGTST